MSRNYKEQVYAGVLGKVIGVYFGRPVEGWMYEKIRDRFSLVDHYVNKELNMPLHIADDDLAGTFTFLHALEDYSGDLRKITARDFGETWLNYIIENKTIFWWGGFGRSTEHTAYLRLKQGMSAPESGSAGTNGKAVSEQIGAQIFMDALALLCPDDPEMARYLVRQCASVSHDGTAVESACFLASLEAMAFSEGNMQKLLKEGLKLSGEPALQKIVGSVWEETEKNRDFRYIRDWLEEHYSYRFFPGNCHVVPNLALITACLLLGGDDFGKALTYCVSAGWDTDCNGANIGCLNGIRLGLSSISSDFRTPIADRFYCISADGGRCVTDAVRETERIVRLHNRLYQESLPVEEARFSFSQRGSVQGFSYLSGEGGISAADGKPLSNRNEMQGGGDGLLLALAPGEEKEIAAPVMWDKKERYGGYMLLGSPSLYETQNVKMTVRVLEGDVELTPFVVYYDFDDRECCLYGTPFSVSKREGSRHADWKIPQNNGYTIRQFGIRAKNPGTGHGEAVIERIDWKGAPEELRIAGSLRNYDMGEANMQLNAFTASAAQFSFDSYRTFVISHTEENGTAVIGDAYWSDYSLECTMLPGLAKRQGIIGRVKGLRHYYGLLLSDDGRIALILRRGSEERVLAEADFPYEKNREYRVSLRFSGGLVTGRVKNIAPGKEEDAVLLEAKDTTYSGGGCGFVVDCGTFLADDLIVRAVPER